MECLASMASNILRACWQFLLCFLVLIDTSMIWSWEWLGCFSHVSLLTFWGHEVRLKNADTSLMDLSKAQQDMANLTSKTLQLGFQRLKQNWFVFGCGIAQACAETSCERPPKPPSIGNSYTRTLILDTITKLSGTIGVTQKMMTFDTHVCQIFEFEDIHPAS